jgi:hypothetical protein
VKVFWFHYRQTIRRHEFQTASLPGPEFTWKCIHEVLLGRDLLGYIQRYVSVSSKNNINPGLLSASARDVVSGTFKCKAHRWHLTFCRCSCHSGWRQIGYVYVPLQHYIRKETTQVDGVVSSAPRSRACCTGQCRSCPTKDTRVASNRISSDKKYQQD